MTVATWMNLRRNNPTWGQILWLLGWSLGCTVVDGLARGWLALAWADPTAALVVSAQRQGILVVDSQAAIEDWTSGRSLWVDVRSRAEYERGHIPWAISVPWQDPGAVERVLAMTDSPERRITVYCRGPSCDEAWWAAQALRHAGVRHVQWFVGGWEAWTNDDVQAQLRNHGRLE